MNLDQIEQDLVWARENADRSAQTRLFVHHVPQMIVRLRALEEDQARGEEAVTPDVSEDEQDVSDDRVTSGDPVASDEPQDEEPSEEGSASDVSVTGEEGLSDTEVEADAQAEAVRNATPGEE